MSVQNLDRHFGARHAARRWARSDAYRTRLMLSLALSLGLATAILRIPIRSAPERVGWHTRSATPLLEVSRSSSSVATRHSDGSVAAVGVPDASDEPAPDGRGQTENLNIATGPGTKRMRARETVYEFVDSPPAIRGGLGAYYINIKYPDEAVRQGIEGRLMLRFVVDTEGRPTDIVVRQPLHPLCDSAAVRALRETRFVPGSQNGQRVSVRMHLPVRFRLVEAGTMSRGSDSLRVP